MPRRMARGHVLACQLAPYQVRTLCRLGVGLRWVAITFASLAGVLTSRAPRLLPEEIVAAIAYNGLVLLAVMRAEDRSLRTIALVTTVIDQVFCFAFIGLYNVLPGSHQVAAYIPATVEAVAFFGIAGAVLSVSLFAAGLLLVDTASSVLGQGPLDGAGIFGAIMIVVLLAACLAAVHEVLRPPAGERNHAADDGLIQLAASPLRLTDREHEILRLIANGRSNAAIAALLGISERTVKKCLERLLAQLRARNRAEAVAAASRLRLL